jgi:hypothetical protein
VRKVILAATALALAGCGFYHWHKDKADSGAFQHDSADCEQQTGNAAQQQSGSQQQPTQSPWEACMTGKGWVYSSGW